VTWIILGIVVIVVFVLLKIKTKIQGESKITDFPYIHQAILFTPAERSFLGVLSQAIGKDAHIFGKVRVADVITSKTGMLRSEWQKAFNKISGKHFDFILCNKDDLSIMCAIELDDLSHQSKSRKERDSFLAGACQYSSVPLIQMPAKSTYNIGEIKELLSPYLNKTIISILTKEVSPELVVMEEEQTTIEMEEKACPKCSSQLVKKVANKGDNAGNEFWECSSFPKCRHTEAVNI